MRRPYQALECTSGEPFDPYRPGAPTDERLSHSITRDLIAMLPTGRA